MTSETCIIVTGNPAGGAEFVGPFPSVAEASEYAERFVGCEYSIASVDPPAMETSASINRKVASGEWDSTGGSLVAAAPKLLESLKNLVHTLESAWGERQITAPKFVQAQLGNEVRLAASAIAKAEGRA